MSMKDLLNKMSQLEALSAPKTRRVLNESSPAPVATTTSKRSLKDVFNELHEAIPAGAKPLPVMDPTNKQAGMGFVTSNNPAVQNILKNLDPKDVQIVQAPGQAQSGQSQQKSLQPMQASNQQNQTMQEEEFDEAHTGDEAEEKFNKYNAKELDYMLDRAAFKSKPGDAHKQKRAGQAKNAAYNIMWREKYKGDLDEGAKVDRMVKHIEKSEKKSGKSKEEAENIAWATANKRGMLDNKNKKKVKEGDIAPTNGIDTRGAGLGAGRSATTLEGKKPDFLDLDKDGNKKEPMKKAAADKKKKAVKENMNNRIQAARLEGKAHGLKGHAYNGKHYEDMEEARAYHEGFKEGLDECYGMAIRQAPVVSFLKREARMPATTRGMARDALNTPLDEMYDDESELSPRGRAWTPTDAADAADDEEHRNWGRKPDPFDPRNRTDDMEENALGEMGKSAYMKQQAIKTPGNTFKAFGQTMHDKDVLEGDFAFEAWDRQLNSLINEGLSVSISKGQQNSPDSVNVNATDAEADKLLSLVKQAGMGIFGGDDGSDYGSPEMGGASEINSPGGIEVVGDHDGMLGLMKKLSGIQGPSSDYEEEDEGCEECGHSPCGCNDEEEMSESRCNECGMMESKCGCNEEVLDEVESEDQMAAKVAEGGAQNPSDSGAANATNDEQGNAAANQALAKADAGQDIEDGMQDQSVQEELEPWMDKDAAEDGKVPAFMRKERWEKNMADEIGPASLRRVKDEEDEDFFHNPNVPRDQQLPRPPKEINVKESFMDLYKKLAMLSEESTAEKDEKAEKAGKKVAKDIEYDEGHKGKDDDKAEKAGKKVTKDIEYDDKKDKKEKVDEWANQIGKGPGKGTDASFEQDIEFMTKVISGGLNKPKSTGQTTIPVVASQLNRLTSHNTTDINESVSDWKKLAGIK